MIPFTHFAPPVGLFGMGAFLWVYLALLAYHLKRLLPRFLDVTKEKHSRCEEGSLGFYAWLPGGSQFWTIRTLLEPLTVFLFSIVLRDFHIITPDLAIYLKCAAFALMMRSVVARYRTWEIMRDGADAGAAAPIIARIVENTASVEEMNQLHISLPNGTSPEMRAQLGKALERSFSPYQ